MYSVRLQAENGMYLCAEGGGGGEVVADRTTGRRWETFVLAKDSGGTISSGDRIKLQAHTGHYVSAEGGGGGPVVANRPVSAGWETFRIANADGSSGRISDGHAITLQAQNGLYLCAEGGGGGPVVADRDTVGSWETFSLELVGPATLRPAKVARRVKSNLRDGRYMNTSAMLDADSGRLTAHTHIWTITHYRDFKGVVEVMLVDRHGVVIGTSGPRQYGVEGTATGVSDRTIWWEKTFGADLAANTTQLEIVHGSGGDWLWGQKAIGQAWDDLEAGQLGR